MGARYYDLAIRLVQAERELRILEAEISRARAPMIELWD
jgi:hypothetical protein